MARRVGLVRVVGRSMLPALRAGDLLLVAYDGVPEPGQAVLVRLPNGPGGPRPIAVKRAVWRESSGWWVERDNPNEGVDSWTLGAVHDCDVLAVVLLRVWPPRPRRKDTGVPD